MTNVGTLSAGVLAAVDARGAVTRGGAQLTWRVRSGDEWVIPGSDGRTRSMRPGGAPIVDTSVRVAGGDAVQRIYAVDDGGGIVVAEVENASPEAIGVAFALHGAGGWVLSTSRPVGVTEADGAMVFPVPHRTSLRVALANGAVDTRALPDARVVARGWDQLLERGLRTELPDPLERDVDAARADLLLAAPSAATFAMLEAWGFDREAIAMWDQLGLRPRRAARRTPTTGVLAETRAALVCERRRAHTIDVLPGFRPAWLGQSLAVHNAPVRDGVASFALRWHGARPALLWAVPPGHTVRVPALDASFSTTEPVGDALLAEPSVALLPMGERAPTGGATVAPPAEFS